MCEGADVFFCCKNKKRKDKKPKGFVHFMLKEILDTSCEINKNLSVYGADNDCAYKFSNIIKNGARVRIFASNEMIVAGILLKSLLEKEYQIKVELIDIKDKNLFNVSVDDVCIFLNNKKSFMKLIKKANSLNCKKILISSDFLKIEKINFDLIIPVLLSCENIKKLTKTYSTFYAVFLLLINKNNFSKIKKACEVIEDLDIMPIVNYAKEIANFRKVNFVCDDKFEELINYYFSDIKFNICKNADMKKDEFINRKYIFVVSNENLNRVFVDSSFCLNNLNKNYLVLGDRKVGDKIKNEELYICTENCGKAIDLVFVFYLQLLSFYVSLFLGGNPDLL